jgi:hypothetical protein
MDYRYLFFSFDSFTDLINLKSGNGRRSTEANCLKLVQSLKLKFQEKHEDLNDIVKPFKIMVSMMDKAEIGPMLMEKLFIDIMTTLKEKVSEKSSLKHEVLIFV